MKRSRFSFIHKSLASIVFIFVLIFAHSRVWAKKERNVLVGRCHGQFFHEFRKINVAKPIEVYQNTKNITSIIAKDDRGQAICELTAKKRIAVTQMLAKAIEICKKLKRGKKIRKEIGGLKDSDGYSSHGLKVIVFQEKRVVNPRGIILLTKDDEMDFYVKLYLTSSESRNLYNLLKKAPKTFRKLGKKR